MALGGISTGLAPAVASIFGGNPSANLGLLGRAVNPDDPEEKRKKVLQAVGGAPDPLADRVIDPAVLALLK